MVMHDSIGEVQIALSQLVDAHGSKTAAKTIAGKLAGTNDASPSLKRNFAVSIGRVALVEALLHRYELARTNYQKARYITIELQLKNPNEVSYGYDLSYYDGQLSKIPP